MGPSSSAHAKVYAAPVYSTSSYPAYSHVASAVASPVHASKNSTAGYQKRYAAKSTGHVEMAKVMPTSSKAYGYAMSSGHAEMAKAVPTSSKEYGYAMSTGHAEVTKPKVTGEAYAESITKEYELEEEEEKYEIEADSYLRKSKRSPYGRMFQ